MKPQLLKWCLLIALCAGLPGCVSRGGPGSSGVLPNTPAPDFSLQDLSGKPETLSQYKGKVVVLDFWATWCPPCRQEIPHLVDLYNRDQKKGLVILGVALDDEGAKVVRPFVDEYNVTYPVMLGDESIQKSYGGIQGIPTTYVIDKEGKVAAAYTGYQDIDVIEKKVQSLL